jgi:hypothetical protein
MRDELVAPLHDIVCATLSDMLLKVINKAFRDSICASASACRNLRKLIKPLLGLFPQQGAEYGRAWRDVCWTGHRCDRSLRVWIVRPTVSRDIDLASKDVQIGPDILEKATYGDRVGVIVPQAPNPENLRVLVTFENYPYEQGVVKGALRVVLRRGSECANSKIVDDYFE